MTAGGVDLSGLAVPDAAAKLDAELAPRLAPDLLIGVAGPAVGPEDGRREAQARLDAHGQARALREGRRPSPWRPRSATPHAAVAAFVAQIAKQVGKPARDAKIKITLRHIYRQRSRPGRGLDVAAAAKAIDAAIDDPAAPRVLHQPLTRLRAKVNANDLARVYNTVDHDRQGALQAAPVQGPEVPQELRRRRRPAGLPDAQRALRDPGQAGQPGVVGAQLARGPASCRAPPSRAAAPPTR